MLYHFVFGRSCDSWSGLCLCLCRNCLIVDSFDRRHSPTSLYTFLLFRRLGTALGRLGRPFTVSGFLSCRFQSTPLTSLKSSHVVFLQHGPTYVCTQEVACSNQMSYYPSSILFMMESNISQVACRRHLHGFRQSDPPCCSTCKLHLVFCIQPSYAMLHSSTDKYIRRMYITMLNSDLAVHSTHADTMYQ